MNDIISAIVPIYKVKEEYLKKCIDSILNQTYENLELILVLDGASDDIYKICEYYRNNDSRVNLYFQKNLGVSVARNKGIELAKGKYITFIDADDWIENDIFFKFNEKIIKLKTEFDFIMCKSYNNRNNIDIPIKINIDKDTRIDENFIINIFQSVYGSKYGSLDRCESIWGNFYSKDFILKNNITFKSGIEIGEDLLFNIDIWCNLKQGIFINDFMYHYRINEESVMNDKYEIVNNKYEKMLIEFYKKQENICSKYSENSQIFCLKQVMRSARKYIFAKEYDMKFLSRIKEFKKLCNIEIYKINLKKIKFCSISLKKKVFLLFIKLRLYSLFVVFMILCYKRKEM